MSRKYAEGGKPDFHNLSDKKVQEYSDLIQNMIYAYKRLDPEVERVLEKVWKDLSNESTHRLVESSYETTREFREESVSMIKTEPKLKRSPVRRRK